MKDGDKQEVLLAAALASEKNGKDAIDTVIMEGLGDSSKLDTYRIEYFQPFDPVPVAAYTVLNKIR